MSDTEVEAPLGLGEDEDIGEDLELDLNLDDDDDDGTEEGGGGRAARSFLAGLLLGAVVGLSVALLFAPEPGEDTRRKLGKGIRRLRERAGDETEDLKRRARKRLARARR